MNAAIADYKVFPRHVGKWEGLVRVLDANLQENKCYKIAQVFDATENKWVISNTYLYSDGTSVTHVFDVIPMGNSEVEVKTEAPALKDATMKAIEHGESTIDFKVFNSMTGKLQGIETITLVSEQERVRTTQMFDQEGAFKGLMVIVERRVD